MRTKQGVILAIALLLGVMVAVSCGGGEEPTPVPPTPTSAPAAPVVAATPTSPAPPATPTAVVVRPTPTAAPSAPKYGGVLRVRDVREWAPFWDTWDNFGGFTTFVQNMVSNLVRYDFDDAAKIVPDLASEWSASPDGLSYTFKIRRDVTWHDGRPFTVEDVVWNLNRGINPPGPTILFNRSKFLSAQSVEAVDASTVKVTMKRPSASFFPSLAAFSVLMYPPYIESAKWYQTPVGTGPFKFVSSEANIRTVLQRYDKYHHRDAAGNRLPYLDGMEIFVIPDSSLAFSAFRTGRLDCGCGHDHDFVTINADRIRRESPGANVWLVLADQFNLMFNFEKKPFNDVRVREAFSRFLDRRALVKLPRGGYGRFPPHHMQSPEVGGQWGLPDAEMVKFPGFTEPFSAEVAKAKDLLKEAGLDPKTMSVTFLGIIQPNVGPYHEAAHALLLTASGANIRYQGESSRTLPSVLEAKGWDISMSTGGTSYDDPSAVFLEFVLSTGARNREKLNYGIDDLAAQQEATLDSKKRRDIVYEMQRKLIREAKYIPAVYQVDGWATHAHVKGWRPPFLSVGPQNRMERVWIDR